ncbi:MAG: putative bifunctional diguanylate cyclase/phosphodiesterase [Gammaproteobacteria bacterium]
MNSARKRLKLSFPTGKLMPVIVIFLSVAISSLFLIYTAMAIQSTMRALVNGEALWSRAQKDAVLFINQYAESGAPGYYHDFNQALAVTMGNRRARLELEKPHYDYKVVRDGFLAGGNHPEDIRGVTRLFRCCAEFGYLARAIDAWEQADAYVLQLKALANQLHEELLSPQPRRARIDELKQQIRRVDQDLRPLEIAFSETLGEAARWLNDLLLWVITGIVAALITLGMYASGHILNRIWQSESKYRALLDTANDALVVIDQQAGAVLACNRRAEQMTGVASDRMIGTTYLDLYPPEQQAHAQSAHAGLDGKNVTRLDLRHDDGRLIPAEVSISTTIWDGRRVNLAIIRDISERMRAEEDLRVAANALADIAEGVMITDGHKHIMSVNKAFMAISGYSLDEVIGKHLTYLQSDRHQLGFYRALWEAVERTGHWQGEIWSRRRNGEVYPALLSVSAVVDDHGRITHYVGVFNDISQYKNYEERLEYLAHHDALTQLPNRIFFEAKFREAMRRASDQGKMVGLLFIDLDDFKNVNDRYGHAVGDELLVSVARRIRSCVRQNDVIARVGGDEFTVLLDNLGDPGDVTVVAQKLLDAVSMPVVCGGQELSAFASIGVSYYPRDGDDVQTLLSNADTAMYEAKQDSRNAYKLFSPGIKARASAKAELANALHQAYQHKEFSLAYQPCIDLVTGKLTSVEALIRWRHPQRGNIPPSSFIPLAEDIGLIRPITEWVLKTACQQAADWRDQGLPPFRMAVNISARHFRDRDLARTVDAILKSTGWQAQDLSLEITERVVMRTDDEVEDILTELHDMGIAIALDDFGTGYSSLSYLKHFPIDYLKIDRSFTSGIPTNPNDVTIAKTIIAMAKNLNIRIIAEGIETEQQHSFLRAEGCQEGQGYLFSKPLAAADLEELIGRNKCVFHTARPRMRVVEP